MLQIIVFSNADRVFFLVEKSDLDTCPLHIYGEMVSSRFSRLTPEQTLMLIEQQPTNLVQLCDCDGQERLDWIRQDFQGQIKRFQEKHVQDQCHPIDARSGVFKHQGLPESSVVRIAEEMLAASSPPVPRFLLVPPGMSVAFQKIEWKARWLPCKARYSVFKDLWSRGLFVASGTRFGCDFLLYPQNPSRFHSSHMVSVIASPDSEVNMFQLSSLCRLATGVNKKLLVAQANSARIEYLSLHRVTLPR
jgi:tRNA-splicing endonuclease subunit Sen34